MTVWVIRGYVSYEHNDMVVVKSRQIADKWLKENYSDFTLDEAYSNSEYLVLRHPTYRGDYVIAEEWYIIE